MAAGVAAVLAALAFAPALAAGFHPEDFGWLALVRHIDSPWPLLTDNAYFVYYYRPVGLLFWWLSAQIAGLHAGWHNVFDLALHAGNAALLGVLAGRLSQSAGAAWIAGCIFALLPAASGTALWMSDRYDPLALLFCSSALLAFEASFAVAGGATRKSRPALAVAGALFLVLALLSKEVAYAVPGLLLLRLAWRVLRYRRVDWAVFWAVILPVGLAIAMRVATVQSMGDSIGVAGIFQVLWDGSLAWWHSLPAALLGFRAGPAWYLIGLIACAALVLVGAVAALRASQFGALRVLVAGGVLLMLPALIQWPVTSQVLVHEASRSITVNLRFFHMAMAAVALLMAGAWCGLRTPRWRVAYAVATIAMGTIWFGISRDNAADWTRATAATSDSMLRLGRELGAQTFPAGCRIRLDAKRLAGIELIGLDLLVKAAAPRAAPVLSCVVVEEKRFAALVPIEACKAESWPSLTVRALSIGPAIAPFGNLCNIAFEAAAPSLDGAEIGFAVDAGGQPTRN